MGAGFRTAAAVLLVLVLMAMVGGGPTRAAAKLKVAVALPGIITDKGFNQSAYEALKRREKELGAETAYTERIAQPDQAKAMSDYARRGCNKVVAHGGGVADGG